MRADSSGMVGGEQTQEPKENILERPKRDSLFWRLWNSISDKVITTFFKNYAVVQRELQLFIGTTLLIIGVFGFSSGKYCDGNTSEYLSCTRPSTFYYYDGVHVILVILGVTLILLWLLRRYK